MTHIKTKRSLIKSHLPQSPNKIYQVIPKEKNLQEIISKMKQSPKRVWHSTKARDQITVWSTYSVAQPLKPAEIRSQHTVLKTKEVVFWIWNVPYIRRLLCPRDDRSRHTTTESFISGWLALNLRPLEEWGMVIRRFCDLGWVNVCENEYLGLKMFL